MTSDSTNPNPYAPPAAPVADIEEARIRPWRVKAALLLYCSSIALAVPEMIQGMRDLNEASETYEFERVAMLVGFAIAFALGTLIFIALWKGWRWGRIVYAALVVLALIASFSSVPESFSLHWLYGVANLASSALDLTAVVLLFSPPANAWFRKPRR